MFIDGQKVSRSHGRRITIISLIVLVVVAVSVAMVVRHQYYENLKPVSSSSSEIMVDIPRGSTTKEIAQILKDKGLIRATWAFQWYLSTNDVGDKLQAGTYNLRANQSVEQIVAQLTHGAVATKLVTIIPGTRITQVKQAFIDSGFQQDEVDKAFDPALYKDSPVLADMPAGVATLEGLLYPDSYQRDNSTKPEEIVREALNEMQSYLTPAMRASFTKQGLTVYQGLILASIVEQEEPVATDRPIVAQVFLKRLDSGIMLGSDITALYGAVKDGVQLPDNPSEAANQAIIHDSPYNTRIHTGLPPTPVSTIEKTALEAVANPADTDYLYFVAGKDCATHFGKTLAEHNQNIQKYGLSTDNPACYQ